MDYLKGRSSYRILGLWDTISDEKSAELICQDLMEKHPDISGIYDISYKSEAIARRLVRMRRDQDIKLIGFDYYDAVKPFIRSSAIDVIIGQSLPNQAYDAVKMNVLPPLLRRAAGQQGLQFPSGRDRVQQHGLL